MRIGRAVPAPAVGRAWLLRALARGSTSEGALSHPGNRGFFLWLKALGDVGAYQCTEFFSKVLRLCLESELEPKRGCCLSWLQEIL
jgi:hypothetical protein